MTRTVTSKAPKAPKARSGEVGGPAAGQALPEGVTHPYDAAWSRPRLAVFRHGHTFTWCAGDRLVAIQRGRVANAKRATLITDVHPADQLLVGRYPVIGLLTPPADGWGDSAVLRRLADQWAERTFGGRHRG
ncbi:hypothetical protein [Amycolatopsis arida]|uniref:hypothetical protein n=1 Tax=Amycolatopsis arida TaxID=587909 RepID=UPI001065F037|nr:hypothetical protein [Amycolatopsis arida]